MVKNIAVLYMLKYSDKETPFLTKYPSDAHLFSKANHLITIFSNKKKVS